MIKANLTILINLIQLTLQTLIKIKTQAIRFIVSQTKVKAIVKAKSFLII